MVFTSLEAEFSVCKIRDAHGVDFARDFVFLSKTDEEISSADSNEDTIFF